MSDNDRLPTHERAFDLFVKGYPIDTAQLVARSELEQQRQRLDVSESSRQPLGKMTGADRHG